MIGIVVTVVAAASALGAAAWVRSRNVRRRAALRREDSSTRWGDKGARHADNSPRWEDPGARHADNSPRWEDPGASQRGSPRLEVTEPPTEPPTEPSRRDELRPTPPVDPPVDLGRPRPVDPGPDRQIIEIPPTVLLVSIDGGGTSATADVPITGWAQQAQTVIAEDSRTAVIEGVELERRRTQHGVQLTRPSSVMLLIGEQRARIVIPSAALELVTVEEWQARWFPWASAALGVEAHTWETAGLDIRLDTIGVEIPDEWVILEDAWVGRSVRRRPKPDGYDRDGRLGGFWIGSKADSPAGRRCDVALHAYNKSDCQRAQGERPGSKALTAAHELAAIRACPELAGVPKGLWPPVWRWETHIQGKALQLTSANGEWSLTKPSSWANSEAIKAALAYIIGVPGQPTSGVIRLTDDRERDRPKKRRGPHPIWQLLRTAAEGGPTERIIQKQTARRLEIDAAKERAARRVARELGQYAGAAHRAGSPSEAAKFAIHVVPEICERNDWIDHVAKGRIRHAAMHETTKPEDA